MQKRVSLTRQVLVQGAMLIGRGLAETTVGLMVGAIALWLVPANRAPGRSFDQSPDADGGAAVPRHGSDDDEPMPAHAVEVADYTMRATLDTASYTVHGAGTIVWRNTSQSAVRELWVHLYLNAFKNERSVFLRGPLGSGRGTEAVTDWGHIDVRRFAVRELGGENLWAVADKTTPGDPDDETDIRVPLPRDVPPGEGLTVEMEWDSKMPSIVERTGRFGDFYLVGQWFPKLARLEPNGQWRHFPFYHLTEFDADFGTYDVSIDVPTGFVVGATGVLLETSTDKTRTISHYRQTDVHDFAWTAWPSFREKTLETEGVRVRCLYPPGYDAAADREIAAVAFGLRYFGRRYGKYPYTVLTIVHPPGGALEAGGMEYPTFITSGGTWYGLPFSHEIESITLHEFGHQYFYGLVATDEQSWPVLDEGLNSFAELDGMTAWFGPGSALDFMGLTIGIDSLFRAGSQSAVHNERIAQPAQAFASGSDYAQLVYTRTATVLDTLARVYGRDRFMRALGRYTRRYRYGHPSFAELVAVIRDGVGVGAAKNLETALFDKGWVDYLVADASSTREQPPAGVFDRGGKREIVAPGSGSEAGWQGWALVMRNGTLSFPVDVELWGSDGTVQLVHWDGQGEWIRIPYRGASELSRVLVDPLTNVTVDANLLNNGFRLGPRKNGWRTLERATYAAELALETLLP